MKQKPKAFAFDVIGTLFSIDSLEEKLKAAGLPDGSLKIWFPRVLRDAFALEVAGQYKTFAEVASGRSKFCCVRTRSNRIKRGSTTSSMLSQSFRRTLMCSRPSECCAMQD